MTGIFLTLLGSRTIVLPQPVNVTVNPVGLAVAGALGSVTASVPAASGAQLFSTVGTSNFIVPVGVTSISVVCVGGGGGGGASGKTGQYPIGFSGGTGAGGSLAYANNIPVTPGEVLNVVVGTGGAGGTVVGQDAGWGGNSALQRSGTNIVLAYSGRGGSPTTNAEGGFNGEGGIFTPAAISGTYAAFRGGDGYSGQNAYAAYGGGGAAGYSGRGGNAIFGSAGDSNSGAAGAGYFSEFSQQYGGGGGGVGVVNGKGTTGAASSALLRAGKAGSGGVDGGNGTTAGLTLPNGANGGLYGGGAGAADGRYINLTPGFIGGQGAVYIVWPGTTRAFPSSL